MKRQDLKLKLLRHHGIRRCMVEGNYITIEQFMDEAIQVVEEFMDPKPARILMDTPDGAIPVTLPVWE